MAGKDPVELAILHVLRIKNAANIAIKEKEKAGEGFLRRARELPSLISSSGLVPALLFYAAKSEMKNLPQAIKIVSCDLREEELKKLTPNLEGELGGGEGQGYTLMLAAIIDALEKLGGFRLLNKSTTEICIETCTETSSENKEDKPIELLKGLKRFRESYLVAEIKATAILQPYLIELKKVSEAVFHKE